MDLFFDAPWWLWGIPAAVGISMLVTGLRKADKTLRLAGLVLVLVATTIYLVSRFVETDTEIANNRARALITGVVARDWPNVQSLMTTDATVSLAGGFGNRYDSRDEIMTALQNKIVDTRVRTISVTSMTSKKESGHLTTSFQIYTVTDDNSIRPFQSDWRFTWRKVNGQWLISDIEAIKVMSFDASQLAPYFPAPRRRN